VLLRIALIEKYKLAKIFASTPPTITKNAFSHIIENSVPIIYLQTAQAPNIPIVNATIPATPPSNIDRSAKLNKIDALLAPTAFKIAASYFLAFSVDAAVPIKTKNPVSIVVVAPYKITDEIEERMLET